MSYIILDSSSKVCFPIMYKNSFQLHLHKSPNSMEHNFNLISKNIDYFKQNNPLSNYHSTNGILRTPCKSNYYLDNIQKFRDNSKLKYQDIFCHYRDCLTKCKLPLLINNLSHLTVNCKNKDSDCLK